MRKEDITEDVAEVILQSFRDNTKKQYNTYISRFMSFLEDNGSTIVSADRPLVLKFLSELGRQGLSYSAVNTARSAISSVLSMLVGVQVGSDPLICRYMRGLFNMRPSLPRYSETWDPGMIIKYLKGREESGLRFLSMKLTMLLALLSGQRVATLASLKLVDVSFVGLNSVRIIVSQLVKQSAPSRHQQPIVLQAYEADQSLCVVTILKQYVAATTEYRNDTDALLLTSVKPFRNASKDTLARWIKEMMSMSGVDPKFKAHSVRSASTSAAARSGTPICDILKAAGWATESTFARFYKRNVVSEAVSFGSAVLSSCVQ